MNAGIKHTINQKQKTSIDEGTDSKSKEITWSLIIFAILKYPA